MDKKIDGRSIAKEIHMKLEQDTKILMEKYDKVPGIAVVLAGDDDASKVYARNIIKKAQKCGYNAVDKFFDGEIKEEELIAVINELNNDDGIDGIIIQMPLPKGINEIKVINALSPEKDIDGVTPFNIGRFYSGQRAFIPCTPKSAMRLLESTQETIEGKKAVVIGRSNIVGRPVAELLNRKNATVTICHSRTKDLKAELLASDIIVSAVGRAHLVTDEMIKDGAIVIDVGTNVVEGKLVGDVDYDSCYEKSKAITPVPGGVGPVTIMMLLENTMEAFVNKWS